LDEALLLLLKRTIDHGLPLFAVSGIGEEIELRPLHGDPGFVALLPAPDHTAKALRNSVTNGGRGKILQALSGLVRRTKNIYSHEAG